MPYLQHLIMFTKKAVYQLTCNSCDQQDNGSTTRFIHDRVKEHLSNENIARAEYFLIPDDAVNRRKLGFWILLF